MGKVGGYDVTCIFRLQTSAECFWVWSRPHRISIPAHQNALTICVVADYDGTDAGLVNECDEENNQCCTEVPAFCCVNDLAARAKSGKVQLTWADTGADHYNVYRGTTSGGPYMFIATTDSRYSTYLDLDVVNETTYYYVVREAAIGGEELCQSNEATATPRERSR